MAFSSPYSAFPHDRAPGAGVTAVLGPTNTGKTHLAIERMLGHSSGLIGLPLRLLAREVYNKAVDRAGSESVALITGEEKIKPKSPRFWVSTVEAMPRDIDVSFLAVDEVQIAADLERGHVFTDRILHRRGRDETLLLGAATMRPIIEKLLPGASMITRPRLSTLEFAGDRKITRQPRRTAIVAFSADEVYAIAELIRRQHGGAAVVLGSLSPRTRNAQVEMFQNGDVDYLVATDAVGMAHGAKAVNRLWDACAIPDYRKLSPAAHAELVTTIFGYLMKNGRIPDAWYATQVDQADRTDGDIDTLSGRIAQIRTWTFVANRPDWLADPEHWQGITREVENKLSDALHERLTERFVDRRTSVLMRRLRENTMLNTEIGKTGEVIVEGHTIGRLDGFTFAPDAAEAGGDAKALQAAAQQVLARKMHPLAEKLGARADDQ